MLTVLAVLGGALVGWQSYRAIDFWRFRSTLSEAFGAAIANAIIDDQREMNWAALPQWKKQVDLYRLLRRKLGASKAQGIVRAVVVDMASEALRSP